MQNFRADNLAYTFSNKTHCSSKSTDNISVNNLLVLKPNSTVIPEFDIVCAKMITSCQCRHHIVKNDHYSSFKREDCKKTRSK